MTGSKASDRDKTGWRVAVLGGIAFVLFGIVFTATDMAVVYILTQGGPPPSFSTEMVTTWSYKTGIESGSLGPGAAISLALLPVLAVVSIAMLLFARRTEVS